MSIDQWRTETTSIKWARFICCNSDVRTEKFNKLRGVFAPNRQHCYSHCPQEHLYDPVRKSAYWCTQSRIKRLRKVSQKARLECCRALLNPLQPRCETRLCHFSFDWRVYLIESMSPNFPVCVSVSLWCFSPHFLMQEILILLYDRGRTVVEWYYSRQSFVSRLNTPSHVGLFFCLCCSMRSWSYVVLDSSTPYSEEESPRIRFRWDGLEIAYFRFMAMPNKGPAIILFSGTKNDRRWRLSMKKR